MSTYDEVVRRWLAREMDWTNKVNRKNDRIIARDGVLFSYGEHFPLVRTLRSEGGDIRVWLINGDTFSITTSRHQRIVREVLAGSPGVPSLIIPYSVLASARVHAYSIHPIEIRPERFEPIDHHAREVTEIPQMYRPAARWDEDLQQWHWQSRRHRLGEALIHAEVDNGSRLSPQTRWAAFLSAFDYQEREPLYFFSELPSNDARTVEDAFTELRPAAVRIADEQGRTVARQGDIFGVPLHSARTRALTRDGYERTRWHRVLGTDHVVTEAALGPNGETLGRGCLYHDPPRFDKDHVRCKLGDGRTWHLLTRNTVPLARTRGGE